MATIYSHAGGNPFYLEQLGRAGADVACRTPARRAARGRRATRRGGRDRVGAGVAVTALAHLPRRGGRRRRAVRARSRGGDRGFVRRPGARRPRRPDRDRPRPADGGPAPLRLSASAGAPERVPRPPAGAGGWPRTRGGEALGARGADAAERAHHVEQSARAGRPHAIEVLLEAGRVAAPGPRGGRALVRGGPAPAAERRRRTPGRGAHGARASRCVRWESSSAAARRCSTPPSGSAAERPCGAWS